jgi:ABC-type microcin C transport system permease subunit YejE
VLKLKLLFVAQVVYSSIVLASDLDEDYACLLPFVSVFTVLRFVLKEALLVERERERLQSILQQDFVVPCVFAVVERTLMIRHMFPRSLVSALLFIGITLIRSSSFDLETASSYSGTNLAH